ncbi:MAG: hypothetical protein WEA54_04125, partial [Actinomycetota bacterium]
GMLCGPSSGINVAAALRVAQAHPDLGRIVTAICDTGQRYLSGELFGETPRVDIPQRRRAIDPAIAEHLRARRADLEQL